MVDSSTVHCCTQISESNRATTEHCCKQISKANRLPFTPHPHRVKPESSGLQFTNNGTEADEHSLLTETESEIDLEEDMASIASSLADRLT